MGVWAVVKADAYGLDCQAVAQALAGVVEGFCVFSLGEAASAELWRKTGRPVITLGPPQWLDPRPYLDEHVRPAVSTIEEARALKPANPILCVDTGMQRFACPAAQIDDVIRAGEIKEAFTHAVTPAQAKRLVELLGGRGLRLHAAASALLDQPAAWLDAVRPGLAIYRGAVRIESPLVEVHSSSGPVGYTGFTVPRHGVILCGYAHGLRKAPCLINGQRRRILEVGMQSAYVEVGETDRVGDPVVLLGDGLESDEIAPDWGSTPHEVLLRLAGPAIKEYR